MQAGDGEGATFTRSETGPFSFKATHVVDLDRLCGGPLVLRHGEVVSLTVSEDLSSLANTDDMNAILFATVL